MSSKTPGSQLQDVHETLRRHTPIDGFPLVFDLEASHGSWIVDARTGEEYLDFFSFFASLPLGFKHPAFQETAVRERLLEASLHKPSNSDAYTEDLARFFRTFAGLAMPPGFRYLFFIEGGALAVENALKTAFDWKVRKNLACGRDPLGAKVIHFREAFHGRSGYTLSLTNTDPIKTDYFPKFDWPRIPNPKLRFPVDANECRRVAEAEEEALKAIDVAIRRFPGDIAAIIVEPIQGEGGDNHFRAEFLSALREVANREEALLIFDEVQTGFGLTGEFWAYEHFDVQPDIVAFGKKSQVCGVMASDRVDEVANHVFKHPSRINSTWGGNLVDMVRCEIILETIHKEKLVDNAARVGDQLLDGLKDLADAHSDLASNVRGRGLMCAFDLPDASTVREFLRRSLQRKLVLLPCGEHSIRFRPTLTIGAPEVDQALKVLDEVLSEMEK